MFDSPNSTQKTREPSPDALDGQSGLMVVEFGASWCGYCLRAEPIIASVLGGRSDVQHLKVEDGPGLALGRSYRVKLWPTLVFLRDGQEVARVVRPTSAEIIQDALKHLCAAN